MYCKNCGAEMAEGPAFCAQCGSKNETSGVDASDVNQQADPGKRHKVKPLLLVICGITAVLAIAAVLFVPGLLKGRGIATLNTAQGKAIIEKAEFSDKLNEMQMEAIPGYQFISVWITFSEKSDKNDAIINEDAYISYADGTRRDFVVKSTVTMDNTKEVKYSFIFTVSKSEKYYYFNFPENKPVKINNENLED